MSSLQGDESKASALFEGSPVGLSHASSRHPSLELKAMSHGTQIAVAPKMEDTTSSGHHIYLCYAVRRIRVPNCLLLI